MATRGPNTDAGKAATRLNAVKHGLRSTAVVVRNAEDLALYQRHFAGIVESLAPDGYLETELTVRIAELLWRLQRVVHYEADRIAASLEQMPQDIATADRYGKAVGIKRPRLTLERIKVQTGIRMLPDKSALDNIVRYEAHLHRQLVQTMHELEAIQARRRGEATPLARLDISGPPSG